MNQKQTYSPKTLIIVILIVILFFIGIVAGIYFYSNQQYGGSKDQAYNYQVSNSKKCTNVNYSPMLTYDPELKALDEYNQVCGSKFVDNLMFFTTMPANNQEAITLADSTAEKLKEYAKAGVSPMVVVEPSSPEVGFLDFKVFAAGGYDATLQTYMIQLKKNGVTDDQLGIWMPFPEPQQAVWKNAKNPDDFSASFNRYVTILRQHFPAAQTAFLLDSMNGEPNRNQLLMSYVSGLKSELVTYAGLQGFPWHPRSNNDQAKAVTSAAEFMPTSLIEPLANHLGVKKIIINTGTYGQRKMQPEGMQHYSAHDRQQILMSILTESKNIKADGFEVTINIFAANKIKADEGVDWSYWLAGRTDLARQNSVFTDFVHSLKQDGIRVSIFDAR